MNDPVVSRFLDHHCWSGSPEELMVNLCTGLLRDAACGIPVDDRLLASLRGARVEEVDQDHSGWMSWDGEHWVIRVAASDPADRRRFTVCHEVCHTFFPGVGPRTRVERDVESFDPTDPEEYLCDLGAAELLLPRETFKWLLRDDFTLEDVQRLARHFRASVEATALRCVTLADGPVAVAVIEPSGGELRVRWASSNGLPDIVRRQTVPSTSPIAGAAAGEDVDYLGDTGLIPGDAHASARLMPYSRRGRPVERVLVLLRP